ncbi:transposase [Dehalococcoidia bacterium]|nr:transposase [Dehalococcoidia bacterium]
MEKRKELSQQRKALRLRDFDYSDTNYAYFVTLCAKHLQNPFQEEALAEEVIESLLFIRKEKALLLYCYCLMPDHLHVVLSPSTKSGNISKIMQGFKSYTTRLGWKYGISGKLWQRSFYDHIARTDEHLLTICEYILANPVRKGLVERPENWLYSGLVDPLPI